VLLALLTLTQTAAWVPHYATWPLYADHDVFATAARAWDAGVRPYRDFLCNNFPATIYLNWLLGKAWGWGRTAPFFLTDAALVIGLCVLLIAWSTRSLGRALPGLIGCSLWLSYYLDLNYALAAQRDWHAAGFAVAGLLIAQAWPGRSGCVASAVTVAVALLFRPQAVVFFPACLVEFLRPDRYADRPEHAPWKALATWGVVFGLTLLLGLTPLLAQGLLDDFRNSLQLTAPGSSYNRVTLASFTAEFVKQLNSVRLILIPLVILLLMPRVPARTRSVCWTWLAATLGVLIYKPMSPFPHVYLDHPWQVVWVVDCALGAALLLRVAPCPAVVRLAAILLVLASAGTLKPRFSNPGGSVQALKRLGSGDPPREEPNGYRPSPGLPSAAYYPWDDYREVLAYLRHHTSSRTRVANALHEVPALTGPTGRLSVFPAESVAWLKMVRRQDEPAFALALEQADDAVVVWIPGEVGLNPSFRIPLIDRAIQLHYRFEARFGEIEIWRRRSPDNVPALSAPAPSSSN
jgi:hypothetical protein